MEGEERLQDEHDREGSNEGAAGEAGVKENPEGLCSRVLLECPLTSNGLGCRNIEPDEERGFRYLILLPATPSSAAEPHAFPLTSDRTRTLT